MGKASIVSRGKMSQKSISSFFSKAPVNKKDEKKVAEVNSVEEENPAKTKGCEESSSGESSASLTKPDTTGGGKENSKALANVEAEGSTKPPLRKTAINPFLLKKSQV